eukprot:Colp12_sorted_trinity150504_noHs@16541
MMESAMDLTQVEEPKKKEIRFPIGVGIAGYVAQTGEVVNVEDAYKDSRFNQQMDKETGFKTNTILCAPIKGSDNKYIGVAQLVNKIAGKFNKRDEDLFRSFLVFCGNAIQNAQLYEKAKRYNKQRDVVLKLVQAIVSEFNVTRLLKKIMHHAPDLVDCDKCSVFLVDYEKQELYAKAFDMQWEPDVPDNLDEIDMDED